jgi:hypothetical protein
MEADMSFRRGRRGWKPELLQLERREVPTVISPLAFHGAGLAAQKSNAAAQAKVTAAAVSSPTNGLSFTPNPTIDPSTLSSLGKSASYFTAYVNGPYALARSYFSNVSKQMIFIGNLRGTPGQILHGTMIMRIVIPSTPGAPIYGVANLRDLSDASTGIQLVLDLTATATDAQGRPTQFTWNVDSTSSGSYTNAPGQGTLSIAYQLHGHSRFAAGGAISVFKGAVLPDPSRLSTLYDTPRFG